MEAAKAARDLEEAERAERRPVLALPSGWRGEDVDRYLALYDEQDDALVRAGFHRTSRWWRRELERFLRSGKRRWVIRVGRRGGKSSTITRVEVALVRGGFYVRSAGDMPEVVLMSRDVAKAADRIYTIERILEAVGYRKNADYRVAGNRLELVREQVAFQVAAATPNAVGMTAVGVFCDEVSRWTTRGPNAAALVVNSVRPAMATQPYGFAILASTPYGEVDYHASLYDQGETPHQCVSHAPTWVATDGFLSEEQTRLEEPDPMVWNQEYAAIPSAMLSSAFDRAHVAAAFVRRPKGDRGEIGWVTCDPTTGQGNDAFAYAAGYVTTLGEVVETETDGWDPHHTPPLDEICALLADKMRGLKAVYVFGDSFELKGMRDGLAKLGVDYRPLAWTVNSKDLAVMQIRRWMREEKLCLLSEHPRLRWELERCPAERRPNGKTHYDTNGLDYLSCLMTLSQAVNEGLYRVDARGDIDWAMVEAAGGLLEVGYGL